MYPTVVIVLAETQLSMSDICEIRLPSARLVSEARTTGAMDNQAESLSSRASQSRDVQKRGLGNVILVVKETWRSTSG